MVTRKARSHTPTLTEAPFAWTEYIQKTYSEAEGWMISHSNLARGEFKNFPEEINFDMFEIDGMPDVGSSIFIKGDPDHESKLADPGETQLMDELMPAIAGLLWKTAVFALYQENITEEHYYIKLTAIRMTEAGIEPLDKGCTKLANMDLFYRQIESEYKTGGEFGSRVGVDDVEKHIGQMLHKFNSALGDVARTAAKAVSGTPRLIDANIDLFLRLRNITVEQIETMQATYSTRRLLLDARIKAQQWDRTMTTLERMWTYSHDTIGLDLIDIARNWMSEGRAKPITNFDEAVKHVAMSITFEQSQEIGIDETKMALAVLFNARRAYAAGNKPEAMQILESRKTELLEFIRRLRGLLRTFGGDARTIHALRHILAFIRAKETLADIDDMLNSQ